MDAERPRFVTIEMEETSTSEHIAASPEPPSWLRPLRIFAYTVEPNAPLYRALARVFAEAKARYRIQLRPAAVSEELERMGYREPLSPEDLDRALEQLVGWGNLRRSHDTARVTTLEDFRRRQYRYQLTPAGEAAERAVGAVLDALATSGSLQSVMLSAILANLEELLRAAKDPSPDAVRLARALFDANQQFEALAENASTFLGRLHEAIDAGEAGTEAFILYKQAVLEYLEKFIGELAAVAPRISDTLTEIERRGTERLLRLAATVDAAPTPDGVETAYAALVRRWQGMVAWFQGDASEPATVEALRAAARSAIGRILQVLERIHQKRFRRVNRAADLLRLAHWFEECGERGDAEAAHRLFDVAFGLGGARHFGGVHEDPDTVASGTSWWQARPVPVAPMLRAGGRGGNVGRAAAVEDLSKVRRELAARQREQSAAQERALALFAGRGALDLAQLPRLDKDQLALLLSLLDRLLTRRPDELGRRRASSRDGRLRLRLDAPAGTEPVVVVTETGRLRLPGYTLTVEDRLARHGDDPVAGRA